jgi:hypothetical protein
MVVPEPHQALQVHLLPEPVVVVVAHIQVLQATVLVGQVVEVMAVIVILAGQPLGVLIQVVAVGVMALDTTVVQAALA